MMATAPRAIVSAAIDELESVGGGFDLSVDVERFLRVALQEDGRVWFELWDWTRKRKVGAFLTREEGKTLVTAVLIVVDELQEKGLRADAVPERSFFLRPLVDQIVKLLAGAERKLPL